jgi:CheY-like chemotaxis protein
MPNRILLVDDNADSRELLAGLLQGHGYDVHLAQHGKEALSMLPGLPRPCTVLLDLNMPEMGGEMVLNRLAEESPRGALPVIVISGDDRPLKTAYPNIVTRLCKPFEFGMLTRALEEARQIGSTHD